MMVNHMNNNTTPWQSTVLNQMPWMSTSTATDPTMQFGQTPANILGQVPTATTVTPTTSFQTQPSLSQPLISAPNIANIQMVNPTISPVPVVPLAGNPFNPQLFTGQQMANCAVQSPAAPLAQSSQFGHLLSTTPVTHDSHFASSSLTQLPPVQQAQLPSNPELARPMCQQKRSSVEMEDDMTVKEAPPTKQQLSENKLFDRFGTLQLNGEKLVNLGKDEEPDSDSSDDSVGEDNNQGRKDFNRYVYLLFKDKKSNNLFDNATSGAMDRLIRDEREKLSKAVILWSPPLKDSLVSSLNQNDSDDDDDDEFVYNDHRDFYKKPTGDDEDSIIIEEVEDDVPIEEVDQTEADDVMQD